MTADKYSRSITLMCPTCGGTDFASLSEDSPLVRCGACELELTRDDLISRNQENIDMHIEEVKGEVFNDLQKQLQKTLANAFRGNKNIRIK